MTCQAMSDRTAAPARLGKGTGRARPRGPGSQASGPRLNPMQVQETNDLLLQQARDRSARGRLVLATSITDFYAAREASLSARERELIDDILGQIVSA